MTTKVDITNLSESEIRNLIDKCNNEIEKRYVAKCKANLEKYIANRLPTSMPFIKIGDIKIRGFESFFRTGRSQAFHPDGRFSFEIEMFLCSSVVGSFSESTIRIAFQEDWSKGNVNFESRVWLEVHKKGDKNKCDYSSRCKDRWHQCGKTFLDNLKGDYDEEFARSVHECWQILTNQISLP